MRFGAGAGWGWDDGWDSRCGTAEDTSLPRTYWAVEGEQRVLVMMGTDGARGTVEGSGGARGIVEGSGEARISGRLCVRQQRQHFGW